MTATNFDPAQALVLGDVPAASETVAGLVERATDAEVTAGTDTSRYVTPSQGKFLKIGNNTSIFTVISSANTRTSNTSNVDFGPTTPVAYTKMKEILYNDIAGTVGVTYTAGLASGSGTATIKSRIYINGVAVGAENSGANNFSADFSVAEGDLIQIYAKIDTYTSGNVVWRINNFYLKYDYQTKSNYITNTNNS